MLSKFKNWFDRWGRITPHSSLYDRALFLLFIILLFIGFVAVTTASFPVAAKLYDDPLYFTIRDAVYIVTGLACFFLCCRFRPKNGKMESLALFVGIVVADCGADCR